MFLHCHNCGWEQDDYWSKDYNPLRALRDWEDMLLRRDLDTSIEGALTWREAITHSLERKAQIIRDMHYRTRAEVTAKNPDWLCPACGQKALDAD